MNTSLKCKRCGHEWIPRNFEPPATCPRCKSYRWKEEKRSDKK